MVHIIDHKRRFCSAADACFSTTPSKPGRSCRTQAVESVVTPSGDFHSDGGSERRDQLNAIRETLEQLEGGTPNVIDV
tara:strand:- start:616 stop:849 length:234 start_codon:yes stop_codon:yes gene_type:complete